MNEVRPNLMESYAVTCAEEIKTRDMMQSLLEHEGWQYLEQTLQDNLTTLREDYEKSGPITEGTMYMNEYRRAQMNMLHTILDRPRSILQATEEVIEQLQATLNPGEEDYGEESTESAGNYRDGSP